MSRLISILIVMTLSAATLNHAEELDEAEFCNGVGKGSDNILDAIKLVCSEGGKVTISWPIPIDIVESVEAINIGYVCYTNSQESYMLKDIDTSTVSKFTISTNESSCLVMGCIRRNIGRGILVWSSLNNATCYFNSDESELLLISSEHSTAMIYPFLPSSMPSFARTSTILTSSSDVLNFSVGFSNAVTSTTNESKPNQLQSQIIIVTGITLGCSALLLALFVVMMCLLSSRKHIMISKTDVKVDAHSSDVMVNSIPTTTTVVSPSLSITTIFTDPVLFSINTCEFVVASAADEVTVLSQRNMNLHKYTEGSGCSLASDDMNTSPMDIESISIPSGDSSYSTVLDNSSSYLPSSSGYISDYTLQTPEVQSGSCA